MGMDSKKLSRRTKQPGHDQTFRVSETNFVTAARTCLDEDIYIVEPNPTDLRELFETPGSARNFGIQPEAKIQSRKTGRAFFVEVKKQGKGGNAEERAMKHHTVQFYETLKNRFGYPYHPYVTVFCESLATVPHYTEKFKYMIEPNQYFLWIDYDLERLCAFLQGRCSAWLD